jgi:chromosome segregation ATPase
LHKAALEEKSREIESLCQSSDQIKTNLDSKEAEVSRLSSMLEERDSKLHQQTKELSGIKTQLETVIVEGNALAKEKDAFTER